MKSSRYPHITNISLAFLLRRKKITLEEWVKQNGIFTYEFLEERCKGLGVLPPTREDFAYAQSKLEISSPTEGVVVLPPPPVVLESTGEIVEDTLPELEVTIPEKKRRR